MRFRKYRIKCFGKYDPKALQCLSFCSRKAACMAESVPAGAVP